MPIFRAEGVGRLVYCDSGSAKWIRTTARFVPLREISSLWFGFDAFPLSFTALLRMPQNLDELFDIVDENDQPVGTMPRREVHRLKQRHRAVHLLVVNRAAKVFLHKRSRKKDLFPGVWDSSAAGHVGSGEDYDSTAVRELEEELGVRLPTDAFEGGAEASRRQGWIRRLFKIEAREETGQEFVWVYRVEAEGPFILEADEIECGEWFTPAEIDRWVAERPQELAPAFLYLWPLARRHFV